MTKKRLIPFRLLPGSWGLTGPLYDEAEARYYLDGEELERRLAEIRHRDDPVALEEANLRLDQQFGKITAHEFDRKLAARAHAEGLERDIALLEVDHRHGKLTDLEFEKQVATLRDEPWAKVISSDYDYEQGASGFSIELDWNEQFVVYLRMHGYVGDTAEKVVNHWLVDVWTSQLVEAETEGLPPLPAQRRAAVRANGAFYQ